MLPEEVLLQLEREGTLKKVIYRATLAREGLDFGTDSTMVRAKGTLLNICYEFVMGCPLVTKRGKDTSQKMDELIVMLPTLNKQVKAGTKREIIRSLTDFFVSVFVLLKKTPLEQQHSDELDAIAWALEDQQQRSTGQAVAATPGEHEGSGSSGIDSKKLALAQRVADLAEQKEQQQQRQQEQQEHGGKRKATRTEEEDREFQKAKRRRLARMRAISGIIMKDLEKTGGSTRLLTVLKTSKTINDLPFPYAGFFMTIKKLSAPGLPEMVDDPAKVEKLKSLMAKLPETLIVNIFKYTNPLKLVTALTQLLLMNPFGGVVLLVPFYFFYFFPTVKVILFFIIILNRQVSVAKDHDHALGDH